MSKKRTRKQFSKVAVKWLMIMAVVDIQLSYLLALLGREQIAETLSVTIVTEIVGVMLGYFAKAFFETREAEKIRLQEEQIDNDLDS